QSPRYLGKQKQLGNRLHAPEEVYRCGGLVAESHSGGNGYLGAESPRYVAVQVSAGRSTLAQGSEQACRSFADLPRKPGGPPRQIPGWIILRRAGHSQRAGRETPEAGAPVPRHAPVEEGSRPPRGRRVDLGEAGERVPGSRDLPNEPGRDLLQYGGYAARKRQPP